MGGWQSANPDPNVAEKTAFDIRREGNNNRNDIIIIPVDFSKHAEDAFDWYVRHIHKASDVVRIIHCQELRIHPFAKELKTTTVEDSLKAAQDSGKSLIEKYEAKLEKHKIQGSVHSQYAASPGELIISSADRFHGNHIVMGSRGLGLIRRSILGSVSHFVLDHSSIPVTIIPKGAKDKYF